MDYKAMINAGELDSVLTELQNEIRKNPGKSELRVFLFQLLCVLGDWPRANKQLKTLATLSKELELFAQLYSQIVTCEMLRASVFAGERTPLIFGEPEPWMAYVSQALPLFAKQEYAQAKTLILKAFEDAPASSGTINDESFAWIADADSRLGPILEIIMNGNYYWLPFQHIDVLAIDQVQDLRDMVWIPVELKLTNGTELGGVVPVRYPGTAEQDDPKLKVAHRTDWQNPEDNIYVGLGQRAFATDQNDYSILATRQIKMQHDD